MQVSSNIREFNARESEKTTKSIKRSLTKTEILRLILNIIVVIFVLFPIIYAFVMSVKPSHELYDKTFFTAHPTLDNYKDVFKIAPIEGYIINSLIVAVIITVFQMVTAILSAFALHFLNFKKKGLLFAIIMATTMIPGETTIISNFLMISGWGFTDSFFGLVAPYLTSAMGIFLFRQAFKSFPMEIYEASKIDGASDLGFIFRILIPLSKPTIGALAVQSFLGAWNMYMWPLLITGSDRYRTVQIGISMLNSADSQSMLLMIAGVVVCMIPSLIIFMFAQKNMVKGLTTGAVKG
ncbi:MULTISPECIES: carbohydrate ABC transporter permease [Anaerococcus]|uniref:carbohydrate ABC transporter permease n=1 Tax=Anaerococcus TaxID=165779 RepID=UPI0027BB13D2|nr:MULTISPECIES: carbohydrate ABC transporter permease [Anaerococcus]MDU2557927.1 carbohydrate ABC transporter permease [Anaerococcus prevotii]